MPKLIDTPTVIDAAGTKPKKIEEFVGNVYTLTSEISKCYLARFRAMIVLIQNK